MDELAVNNSRALRHPSPTASVTNQNGSLHLPQIITQRILDAESYVQDRRSSIKTHTLRRSDSVEIILAQHAQASLAPRSRNTNRRVSRPQSSTVASAELPHIRKRVVAHLEVGGFSTSNAASATALSGKVQGEHTRVIRPPHSYIPPLHLTLL